MLDPPTPPEYYRTPISQFCRPHTKTGCTNIPPHYFAAKIRFQQQLCGNWNICPQTPNIDWDYSNLTPTVHIIRRISDVYKDHLTPSIDQWGLNQHTSADFKHSMFKWLSDDDCQSWASFVFWELVSKFWHQVYFLPWKTMVTYFWVQEILWKSSQQKKMKNCLE